MVIFLPILNFFKFHVKGERSIVKGVFKNVFGEILIQVSLLVVIV